MECQEWWDTHCLYLEPAAREAFANAFSAASHHRSLLESTIRDGTVIDAITSNWKIITDAPEIITTAVALPGLTPAEVKEIGKKHPN